MFKGEHMNHKHTIAGIYAFSAVFYFGFAAFENFMLHNQPSNVVQHREYLFISAGLGLLYGIAAEKKYREGVSDLEKKVNP